MLLTDYQPLQYTILEDARGSGPMRVRGIFQRANTKNANGRVYSEKLWETVLQDPSILESLNRKRMLGVVEHPKDGATDLSDTSHIVTGLWKKGDEVWGEAEILNTPKGKIIQELFRSGVEVGISSRGRGTSVYRNGAEYVDESSYRLETFDFVYKPSTPGAYPKLAEAVDEAYKRESDMTIKTTELKRLEVRAEDVLKATPGADFAKLTGLFSECAELRANVASIRPLLEGEEAPAKEAVQLAESAAKKIEEAMTAVTAALDAATPRTTADLDRRIDNALDHTQAPASTPQGAQPQNQLAALLRETREQRDHFRQRLEEATSILAESEEETTRRYLAAKELGRELHAKLKESTNALAELRQKHQALEERHEAAKKLVAEVSVRQERSRLTRMVREAVSQYPDLAKFSKSLQKAIDGGVSSEELQERIAEYKEALGVSESEQSKDEALRTKPVINQSLLQEEQVEETVPANHGGTLPTAGEAINESQDSSVLEGTANGAAPARDRSSRVAQAVLSSRGWK